jgi:transcriptional regulator with XRE-family HTH domain
MDATNNNSDFAQRLRTLRMQKGLSQRAFTKSIDLNYTQYNRYETGETIPSADTLTKLADSLNVSVDYLLDGKEEDAAVANLSDKNLLNLFQEIESFPEKEKEHITFILESLVKNRKHQQLAS